MSLFRRAGAEQRSHWFGTDSTPFGGKKVTEDAALCLGPFFDAHRFIVDHISTLPVDGYRKDGGRRTEIALPRLLADTDLPGREGLVTWVGKAVFGMLTGNAVGYIREVDGFGFPVDVHWLHWSQWGYDEMTGQWYVGGRTTSASRILHIPWMVPPGRTLGLSVAEHHSAGIRAGLSAQEYADLKRGGGLPPVHIKNTLKTVPPEVASSMRARASASFARGEVFVTGNDWDLTLLAIPPNQAQFIQTLKMSANQVASAFGIDPTEIGGEAANSLTYSTEELRQIKRAADLRPYIERFERGISRFLPARQFIKLNIDATMRVDIKTRIEVEGAQIQDGRMSVNEARELEDRAPVPGGDFHNVPAPTAEPITRKENP